jgi:hypothetical protein
MTSRRRRSAGYLIRHPGFILLLGVGLTVAFGLAANGFLHEGDRLRDHGLPATAVLLAVATAVYLGRNWRRRRAAAEAWLGSGPAARLA